MQILLGQWEGTVQGESGTDRTERTYTFVLNRRFIEVRNQSTYPPQAKNHKSEVHEDRGMISYDRAAMFLRVRGMPPRDQWETLLDVPRILDAFGFSRPAG